MVNKQKIHDIDQVEDRIYALAYKRPAWMLHQRRANLFLVAMKEYNRTAD